MRRVLRRYVFKSESPNTPVLVTVVELDVGSWTSGLCSGDLVNLTLGSTSEGVAVVTLCGSGNQSVQPGFQLLSYGDTLKLSLLAGERRGRRHKGFNFTYQARE